MINAQFSLLRVAIPIGTPRLALGSLIATAFRLLPTFASAIILTGVAVLAVAGPTGMDAGASRARPAYVTAGLEWAPEVKTVLILADSPDDPAVLREVDRIRLAAPASSEVHVAIITYELSPEDYRELMLAHDHSQVVDLRSHQVSEILSGGD
jgi:hypothetical protein